MPWIGPRSFAFFKIQSRYVGAVHRFTVHQSQGPATCPSASKKLIGTVINRPHLCDYTSDGCNDNRPPIVYGISALVHTYAVFPVNGVPSGWCRRCRDPRWMERPPRTSRPETTRTRLKSAVAGGALTPHLALQSRLFAANSQQIYPKFCPTSGIMAPAKKA